MNKNKLMNICLDLGDDDFVRYLMNDIVESLNFKQKRLVEDYLEQLENNEDFAGTSKQQKMYNNILSSLGISDGDWELLEVQ